MRRPMKTGRHPSPRPSPRSRGEGDGSAVLLAWAKDREGRKVHVASIDPAARRARAPFACLGCGEELVAKLGRERARHFAHLPGSTCALTKPETALHLDVKERLLVLCAEAFAGRLAVVLGARCPRCRREAPLDLAAAGDAAVSEGAVGPLRADVLVTRGGAPALALEVLVTHAVDADKELALAAAGVPALEVDATAPWEEETASGVTIRVARTLGATPCPACQASLRAEAGRLAGGEEAEVAELEAYRARGLLGSRPGPALASPPPLSPVERRRLQASFRCPGCGRRSLDVKERLAKHACPGAAPRPVAWRGYDGALVELAWWRAAPPEKR